ncbi:aldo/keto reductase [Herpetosiphon giganteus]|uniref:aldo/keto reductase n=1 Tax=Herpetosiphon giganteus TaxID=2029754 RepID=UPI00195DE1B7|nr:aldo/keto reductase [Herpetosiphon giganteus]MBM7845839.1 aryl-alcohol dehydrogenase-like predicted oxidoreductase [Herpetosiphon giganteus]
MNQTAFRTLGRSGLVVSPLALGTMTFGSQRWGANAQTSADIFNTYIDTGGNVIDTADVYADGLSEQLVGKFIAERGLRDQVVLATKFAFYGGQSQNVNAGGNGRKNIQRALEGSLRRLGTDYIDLYWLHIWDQVTPVEEVLQTLGDLVRAGTIRYFGFSNQPAWYAVRAATLAAAHAIPGPIAMQLEYSLVERNIEREYIPAARECGLGIAAWSPLAAGFLAGKYQRQSSGVRGQGRLSGPNPFGDQKFTERNWNILQALQNVAAMLEQPVSQVALAWAAAQPGISMLIIGARQPEQLSANLAAQAIKLTAEQLQLLNQASMPELSYPDSLFNTELRRAIFGGMNVQGWAESR